MKKKDLRGYFIFILFTLFINIVSFFLIRLGKYPIEILYPINLPLLCISFSQTIYQLIKLQKDIK